MLRAQVKVKDSLFWGLGWAIENTPAGKIIAHSGDNPGYKAFAAAAASLHHHDNGDCGYDEIIANVVKSEAVQRFLPTALV